MELHELYDRFQNIDLDEKTKKAILQLLDFKIETDMEKVLNQMNAINDNLKVEMNAINHNLKVEMNAINHSLTKEIKVMYWVMLAGIGILTVLLTIIALK